MNGSWVGFDLDEVLANLRNEMAAGLTLHCGQEQDWKNWHQYDFYEPLMSKEAFLNMIVEGQMLERCMPEVGALDCVQAIKDMGHKVAVITARGYHPRGQEVTQHWLKSHGFEIDEVIIVPSHQSKAQALEALPPMLAYIDDHLAHLDAIAQAPSRGVESLLTVFDRPWNQREATYHRIHSLDAFVPAVLQLSKRNPMPLSGF